MPERLRATSSQMVALLPDAEVEPLAETMIAFANADGGTIYVGVNEDGAPSGTVFPEELDFAMAQAEMACRPPIPFDLEQVEAGGGFVFVIRVNRSHELHRLSNGHVVVRMGAENKRLSGTQIEQIIASRTTGDYEAEPVAGATRADLSDEALKQFVDMWEERHGRQLTRPLDEVLVEMGWLLPEGYPTVAGILLFGRHPTTFLPRSGVTFVRFEGSHIRKADGEPSYGRRVEVKAYLAETIRRTWEIIKEEIHLGAVVRGLKREEQWIYPPTAIREALVNAVAHRDYRVRGRGIEVRMFPDKLEISSPGGLPGFITLDNIVEEHFSRNPRIVNGLFQWGYIEELGMGVDLMIDEMVSAGHPAPNFRATDASFSVTFESTLERKPLPSSTADLSMNERQAKALTYLQQHERIRSRDYQELCPDVSPETLRLDLVDLVERGVIIKIGRKRGTYYIMK